MRALEFQRPNGVTASPAEFEGSPPHHDVTVVGDIVRNDFPFPPTPAVLFDDLQFIAEAMASHNSGDQFLDWFIEPFGRFNDRLRSGHGVLLVGGGPTGIIISYLC